MTYHKDLPQTWIEIIEKNEVLKELWADHNSEYEAVPEFLFGSLWDELERLEPIFALYGEPGMEMYKKILEVKALTLAKEGIGTDDALETYAGYFYVKEKGNTELAEKLVREYIKAMNDLYENEFESEALLDESADITFVPSEERSKVMTELHKAWCDGNYMPENEMHDDIGDWYCWELEMIPGCEELKDLLWEPLYNMEEDYKMSYYLVWSLVDRDDMKNPYMSYYKLWCMGLTARFVAKDKVVVV